MKLNFSNTMILGGLLYGKLAIILHFLMKGEPTAKFAFNLFYSIAAIAIGLISKLVERRREVR